MNITEDGWQQLVNILSENTDPQDINIICDFLLTKEEKEQLSKRVLLTKELINKSKSQREISKEIGISICTVTRCSNALKVCSTRVKEIFSENIKK
ncbi:Trp operon repressor [Allofrancisella inopinata]|uniref:Trp operon repressor n=1 Tax=Allofrancisella inopinata TaxID=1085647 RepID=A0AAE6YJA2_9GAMM|nr:trp operon repressor [Allofrancisella inopinata]QIV96788.1 trp operon repressor [Allofrancisella inopinata]TDT69070.1 Trp operon repressor [Allofrancisella inopinata]